MMDLIREIAWAAMSRDFKREYNEIRRIERVDDLRSLQERYLRGLLAHAYKEVPYYHRRLGDSGVIRGGSVHLSSFDNIPPLTKDDLRKNFDELTSRDYENRGWYCNCSGGSTGEPTKFIQDAGYRRWRSATNHYYYRDTLSIRPSAKKLVLWGSDRDLFEGGLSLGQRIDNWLTNTIFVNGFRMTESDMKEHIKTMNYRRPDLVRGYAGLLHELCGYAAREGLEVHSPLRAVSEAETLHENMRERIEAVLGSKLYNFYGSREVSNIAGECREGLMHSFAFYNLVEVVNESGHPVAEGEEGKVVVTNLHNYSMPLIRYEIGDTAVLGPKECGCESILPTLRKVTGRITDHFIQEDGTIVPAEFFIHLIGVVCNTGFVRRFQAVQESRREIRLIIVLEREMTELEKKDIEDKIRVAMGDECRIRWDFVDEIPKTGSGKYRYTRSMVRR